MKKGFYKMSELEKAIEQLKSEGYSSQDIQNAISKMKKEALKQPKITGSLNDYLDSLANDKKDH